MKIFLTLLNIVLAGLVVWAASGFFKTPASQTVYTVGRDRSKTTENRTRVSAAAPAAMSIEEAAGLVTRYNLFNITRCPDAVSGRRGPSAQQMTLIGIYKMGNSRGAIIQQTQQRSWRRTTTNTNNAQQPIKQFYTVGEVLSNGYTLASIDDGQVTLSRGGSTMQLQLEKAGRGISTSATTTQTQRRLSTQQLQQFMMMGQMRMMQQMMQQQNRMLQQNRNQQQGQIPSSNRRNSSSSSSRSRSR